MKTIVTITIMIVLVLALLSGWSSNNENNNDNHFGMIFVDSFTILSTPSLSITKRQTTSTTTCLISNNNNCYINPLFFANSMKLSQIRTTLRSISSRPYSFLVLSVSTNSETDSDSSVNNRINDANTLNKRQQQQQQQQQQHTSRRDILLQTAATTSSLLLIPTATAAAAAATATATATAITTKDVILSKAVCDPTVSVWTIPMIEQNDLTRTSLSPKFDNRIVYILGTAHISEVSAELAGRLVQDTHPNAVFVELDIKRLASSIRSSASTTTDGSTTTVTQEGAGSILTAETTTGSTSRIVIPVLPSGTRRGNVMGATTTSANVASAQSTTGSDDTDNNQSSSSGMVPTSSTSTKGSNNNNNNNNGLVGSVQKSIMNYATMAVGNAIRGMYKNLNTVGFNPGEEFIVAINEGQKINADIILGDQDVELTLSRLTTALSQTNINKLLNDKQLEQTMSQLVPGTSTSSTLGFTNDNSNTISKEENDILYKKELTEYIETIKSRDNVRTIMYQLQQVAPELVSVMLTERDTYMATGIDIVNQYQCIVAIVGIAHMDGIEQNLSTFGWKQIPIQTSKQCTT